MGVEIERKFLVRGQSWRKGAGVVYRQGYLCTEKDRTVRVRVAGNRGWLTIKGATQGATRREYEYDIAGSDADEMLDHLCVQPLIEKRRYRVEHQGLTWEIDEFFGDNLGLVLAEVELASEDQEFDSPPWVGEEVTADPRYFNANLVETPYTAW